MPNYRKGYDEDVQQRLQDVFDQVTGGASVQRDWAEYAPKTPQDYAQTIEENEDFEVEEYDEDETPFDASPVPLNDIPTSSTNAGRPRTVAAGFQLYIGSKKSGQARKGKMTVMFRDGTLYNYYDVTPEEWLSFKDSISKGAPWLNRGFDSPNARQRVDGLFIGRPRGPADLSQVSEAARKTIYRVARTAQVRFASKRSVTIDHPDLNGPKTYSGGYVSKTSVKKAQLKPGSATSKSLGKNPSSGGKPPKRK